MRLVAECRAPPPVSNGVPSTCGGSAEVQGRNSAPTLTLGHDGRKFWEEETEHSPEARVALHEHQEKVKKAEELKKNPPKPKKERRFFKGGSGRAGSVGVWRPLSCLLPYQVRRAASHPASTETVHRFGALQRMGHRTTSTRRTGTSTWVGRITIAR